MVRTTLSLSALLREMYDRGASDLLLTAGTPPHFRLNGELVDQSTRPLTDAETAALAQELLTDEQMKLLRRRRSVDLSRGVEGLSRFRINVYYQRNSTALAIRMIPFVIPGFEELRLPPVVREFASKPHGLVLVTGPAGSGKSTTLAAMIDYINHDRHVHVVCLEDPIEYLHHHAKSIIAQREIGEDAPSFVSALRGVFRQSPDVIMVGEMRDLETMRLVLTLAETGHLILATLHTQDATHAVSRLVDSFPPEQQQQVYLQLSLVLVGVISQQLLVTRTQDRRVPACEVLCVNNAVRNLIREHEIQQIYSVIQTGGSEGMMTMNESLVRLWREGLIETDLALRRTARPRELGQLLRRG